MDLIRFFRKPPGLPPGTLHKRDTEPDAPINLREIAYSADGTQHRTLSSLDDQTPVGAGKRWLNIDGIHDHRLLETIGKLYALHPLVVEDVADPTQRPSAEAYDGHVYTRMPMIQVINGAIAEESISLILTPEAVLTFQENEGDVFDPIRRRIDEPPGRMRASDTDYLYYALIDVIVDNVDLALEAIADQIASAEDLVMTGRSRDSIALTLHQVKREVMKLRRSINPMREAVAELIRDESGLISKTTRTLLKDVADHIARASDTATLYADWLTGILDLHLSLASHRMNGIMKTLALISAVFLPLTFMAGIYGMNFANMPELQSENGYFILLGAMFTVALLLLLVFRFQKWFR